MQKGFTLIELVVTIAVIAIISALVFADFSGNEKRLALKRMAYQVAQDLRETEEMVLASVSGTVCGSKKVCGFGLNFNKQSSLISYLIFADCDNNCSNSNHKKDGSDKIIKTVFLEKTVEIEALSPLAGNNLDIVFTAPDPVVWINNEINWGAEAAITLKSPQAETRAVKVNSVGRVVIE